MAEVSTFPRKDLSYPDVNIKILSQGVKNISRLSQLKAEGVEVLQEKAQRVGLYSRRLDDVIRESLSGLHVRLKNLLTQTYFSTLAEIDEAMNSNDLDDESKAEMRQERQHIINSLSKDISQLNQLFSEKTESLDKTISDLHNVVIIEGTDTVLRTEYARQKRLVSDISAKNKERKNIEQQRDKIISALDVIREHNLIDAFSDLIPTGDSLNELDLTKPELELIKQSLDVVKKVLGQLSSGLKYIDLTDARKRLDNQIDVILASLTELNNKLEKVEQLISGVNAVINIDKERAEVLSEAEKLSRAWHMFISEITELHGASLNERHLSNLLKKQQNYLDLLINQLSQLQLN
ncbi:Uncharacterised protein [Yersinia frederiksenii]|nr:Uncharacterised protein [Yersinia frederiksenii]